VFRLRQQNDDRRQRYFSPIHRADLYFDFVALYLEGKISLFGLNHRHFLHRRNEFVFLEEPAAENRLASSIFVGNFVALLSGVFFGLYFVMLRHPRSLGNENPAISVFYGNLIIVVLMLPLLAQNPPAPTGNDILAILFLGIFQIGVAYILFTKGIARGVRSLDASIIGFVEPLLNPVWVFIFAKEKPSNWALLGGAIILTTVAAHTIFNNRSRLKREKLS
jgi:drug/metabolite transporter (DMT)-like permease